MDPNNDVKQAPLDEAAYEAQLNDQEQHRREKLEQYKALGIDPFGHKFDVNSNAETLRKTYDSLQPEEVKEDAKVTIAGRIVLLRKMGKASFFTLVRPDGQDPGLYPSGCGRRSQLRPLQDGGYRRYLRHRRRDDEDQDR
jgi:lysyl-tRNA synthetase class II